MTGHDPVAAAALRLFGGVGYDGTTERMIAETAGVDVAEVRARGGRTGLYEAVIADFYAAQNALLDEMEDKCAPDADGVRDFLSRVLDFYLANPEEMELWQHRRLADAADLADIDARYRDPFLRRVEELLARHLSERGVTNLSDYAMLSNVVTWSLYGFLNGGIKGSGGATLRPDDPEAVRLFRAQMHRLQDLVISAGWPSDASGDDRR
ncbi:TetR family transcriptional regulator [Actinocorallia sp. API 0066]|uniref:TetR/AcrR family transcriptional regulator n=1 Tax=Actinocorallia sp. API 0066 TaxID=2896846 RepID=UPI001E36CA28|nr:TetR/AcrR family transcriptional regulator [Actinocorallia sp. API 0066]MCD0448884.1 TetR family transcriptional regulator [Actinocorallia sp. API 0066]